MNRVWLVLGGLCWIATLGTVISINLAMGSTPFEPGPREGVLKVAIIIITAYTGFAAGHLFRQLGIRRPTNKPRKGLATEHDGTARSQEAAVRILEVLSLLVPRRISGEEIGDAMEVITRLAAYGRPAWQIYLHVVSTTFLGRSQRVPRDCERPIGEIQDHELVGRLVSPRRSALRPVEFSSP